MIVNHDIEIYAAADYVLPVTLRDENRQPIDLTGATVEAAVAEFAGSAETTPFAAVHNSSGGHITLTLPHEITERLSYSDGVYDVFVTYADGSREQVLNGKAKVIPAVTRFVNDGEIIFMVVISKAEFLPDTGEEGRLYYCTEPNVIYRWNGTGYVSVMRNYSVAVGTTTTLDPGSEATVTNSGTETDLVLDFGIPAGRTGEGSVSGPDRSVDGNVAAFDGTTGEVLKDSGFSIGASVPAGAKFTDTTYTASTETIGSASAGADIDADDITGWDAGTLPSASVEDEVLTINFGSLPSLSYSAKSIPNISVTSKSVVTGITAS